MQIRKITSKADRIRVVKWIRSGAPVKTGVSLYASLPYDRRLLKALKESPSENAEKMIADICMMMGIPRQKFNLILKDYHGKRKQESNSKTGKFKAAGRIKKTSSYRSDWKFLSQPDCPTELKALAADKISCWQRYTEAHKKLFDCTTLEECHQAAFDLIENFKENRLIHEEFEHYQEQGIILGKHRIWNHYKKFKNLRGMNVIELVKLHEKTLPHKIWRIESEIKKGDKPHLQGEREKRLDEVKGELAEVKRLLGING